MSNAPEKSSGVIGAIFIGLAVFKLLKGDDWVVWAILGVLFGGLSFFRRRSGDGATRG